MGETRSMQPLITVKGRKDGAGPPSSSDNVVQPVEGWLNAQNARDAVFHVHILEQSGTAGPEPKLILETAASAAGPWAEIISWDGTAAPPINVAVGASTSAPAFSTSTSYLERFVRWKIDADALTAVNDEWAMCFSICVTLK